MSPTLGQRTRSVMLGVVAGTAALSVTGLGVGAGSPPPVQGSNVFTWGNGNAGQLGNGTRGRSLVPVTANRWRERPA
jgi:hypothetical protein